MDSLTLRESESDLGLVLVPGINSGEKLFNKIEHSLDFSSVRVNAWSGAEDLEEMNLDELHSLIDESIKLLENQGCESIGLIGKSFGAQLALTARPDIEFMVLWAPAIGFGEHNVEKWKSTLLKHAQTATDISVDKAHLAKINSEVKIIQGTEDDVVKLGNSRKICEALTKSEFSVIEDADHSFTDEENKLVSETTSFIEK